MDDSEMSEMHDSPADDPADDENALLEGDEPGSGESQGASIEASSEMEEALREATEALEAREVPASGAGAPDSTAPTGSADKMTIELLAEELQDLKGLHDAKLKEFDDQNEQFLRLQAEFENFRRRNLKEKHESLKFGHQNLVKDLLSAVDNLERALEHGAQNDGSEDGSPLDIKGVLDGVQLVHREILGALAKHGVKEIEARGQIFDPADHEAMGQLPSAEMPVNTILEVLQKGYVIHDRMVRPARVIVSRSATAEEVEAGGGSAEKN
jgi:molecular chaperone GrpE